MAAGPSRVMIVGINYAPESTGIAPYTTAMSRALLAAGLQVHVITGVPHYPWWQVQGSEYDRGNRWDETVDGVSITRVHHFVPEQATLVGRAAMEATFLRSAGRELRRWRSDAVIAVTPSLAGLAAAAWDKGRTGAALGAVVQDLTGPGASQSGTTGDVAGRLIGAGERSLLRRCDLVGVITPRFGELVQDMGVPGDRVVDLPNFTHIVPVAASRSEARARLGWPTEHTLVAHTGNMGMKQGLESVVEAARLADSTNTPVTFVLVGSGNQRSEIESQATGIERLLLVDPLSDDDYPFALAAADVLLINERPGVREMSMPSKLTSYSAAGRPIVAAVEETGITHQVLAQGDAAQLIPPGDPQLLLETVSGLAADAERRAGLEANAALLGQSLYSRAAAERRYVDFATRLLAERGQR